MNRRARILIAALALLLPVTAGAQAFQPDYILCEAKSDLTKPISHRYWQRSFLYGGSVGANAKAWVILQASSVQPGSGSALTKGTAFLAKSTDFGTTTGAYADSGDLVADFTLGNQLLQKSWRLQYMGATGTLIRDASIKPKLETFVTGGQVLRGINIVGADIARMNGAINVTVDDAGGKRLATIAFHVPVLVSRAVLTANYHVFTLKDFVAGQALPTGCRHGSVAADEAEEQEEAEFYGY